MALVTGGRDPALRAFGGPKDKLPAVNEIFHPSLPTLQQEGAKASSVGWMVRVQNGILGSTFLG